MALLVEHDPSKGETLWLIWVTGVAYKLGISPKVSKRG